MTQVPTPNPDEGKPEIETPTPNQEPVIPKKTEPENPETPAEPSPAPNPEPDYKKAYGESTRENQILQEQLKQERLRNQELTKPHDPTEQELRDAFPEWDSMLEHEKRMARRQFSLERDLQASKATQAQLLAEKAWEKDLKNAVKKFPQLKGREEEFEQFVFKPSHQGVSMEVLAKSFLFDTANPPAPTPKPVSTGERSSGGNPPGPARRKYTAEQMRELRKTDYKKWLEITKSGDYEEDL